MAPLIVLIVTFFLVSLVSKLSKKTINYPFSGRIAMAVMLLFTAIGHFKYATGMSQMLPEFIPYRESLVFITGIIEIVFAIFLLLNKNTKAIGWLIILFFILILPANIYAAINGIDYKTGKIGGNGLQYLWFRVPLQVFFIIWVYLFTIKPKS